LLEFGQPSYYLVVHTLEGPQKLQVKKSTPIGNGLVWGLTRPIPLPRIYEVQLFDSGFLRDKLVDRVQVSGWKAEGQRFVFELQGHWSAGRFFGAAIVGLGILLGLLCAAKLLRSPAL
jgi:hypothetical protein